MKSFAVYSLLLIVALSSIKILIGSIISWGWILASPVILLAAGFLSVVLVFIVADYYADREMEECKKFDVSIDRKF